MAEQNKVAIVTGAGSGIGRGAALALAADGYAVLGEFGDRSLEQRLQLARRRLLHGARTDAGGGLNVTGTQGRRPRVLHGSAAAQLVPAPVDGDPVQPRPESRPLLKAVDASEDGHEHLLGDVHCVFAVTEHAIRHVEHAVLVAGYQLIESGS